MEEGRAYGFIKLLIQLNMQTILKYKILLTERFLAIELTSDKT